MKAKTILFINICNTGLEHAISKASFQMVVFKIKKKQIKKQLPKIISDSLSKNSSNKEAFNESTGEYENALKQCDLTISNWNISH